MRNKQDTIDNGEFLDWYNCLKNIAQSNELQWLIAEDPTIYVSSFSQGLSPEDEFQSLADMAEWRGCGCGGGG